MKRNILLNPGPASISMRVKKAQLVPDICPREKEFGDVMAKVSQGLLDFVENSFDSSCVLFGGSGTLAVEAAISSIVGYEDKLAIIVNGAYGERIEEIAKRHQKKYAIYTSSVLEEIKWEALENFLEKEEPTYLALVHLETTTGLLNNLERISQIAKKRSIKIIVDCMSSYGCYPLDLNLIDYIIASSNKSIQGIAGVSFVIAKDVNIEQSVHSRSLYLDLASQQDYFKKNHQMRFTPPVQTLYALDEAIAELKEEGLSNRYKRYFKSNEILRNGLEKMGLDIYPKQNHGVIITSVKMPQGFDFDAMHDYCKSNGFTIYPGKVSGEKMFRIANIGAIDYLDIQLFLQVLQGFLNQQGEG